MTEAIEEEDEETPIQKWCRESKPPQGEDAYDEDMDRLDLEYYLDEVKLMRYGRRAFL